MDLPIYNPMIPCTGHINGGFRQGRSIRIQGHAPKNSVGFIIALRSSDPSKIGLYLNPRFLENTVICNSHCNGTWGLEQRLSLCPFRIFEQFEISIICESHQYKISLNGNPMTEFSHRIPPEQMIRITIEGNIVVSYIIFDGLSNTISSEFLPSAPPISALQAEPPLTSFYPTGYSHNTAAHTIPTATVVVAGSALSEKESRRERRRKRRLLKLGLMAGGVHGVTVTSIAVKQVRKRRQRRRAEAEGSSSSSSSSDNGKK